MLELLALALIVLAGYRVSLWIWPQTYCRRCSGKGRNAGSTRRRFGACGKCGGSGRKPRLGNRVLGRAK